MCINPVDYNGKTIICTKCWQCRLSRMNDWVGRATAEQQTSIDCYVVTLTYGGGDIVNAATLIYSDIQNFFKRLRKDYNVRYICVGEYGSTKGRAHWHCILYFDTKTQIPLRKNISWKYWPHGFAYFDAVTNKSISYVLKYIMKGDNNSGFKSHRFMMSKKPPIGAQYLIQLATDQYNDGYLPHEYYEFNSCADNTVKKYRITGASLELYLSTWFNLMTLNGDNRLNKLLNDYEQSKGVYAQDIVGSVHNSYMPKPTGLTKGQLSELWSDTHHAYIEGNMIWLKQDDEWGWYPTATYLKGIDQCQIESEIDASKGASRYQDRVQLYHQQQLQAKKILMLQQRKKIRLGLHD